MQLYYEIIFGILILKMRPDQARSLNEVFADENIGAAISKIRRLRLRESQSRFAGRLGLTRERLANIETGRSSISAKLGWDFCRQFNVHPNWVMNGGGAADEPQKLSSIPEIERLMLEDVLNEHHQVKFRQFWTLVNQFWWKNECKFNIDNLKSKRDDGGVQTKVPTWAELKRKILRYTSGHGQKAALANEMNISRQVLGNWLSAGSKGAPNAEQTLWLLHWVEQQERQK
jgi:transcriptional regulator with XRE-family HTH domain